MARIPLALARPALESGSLVHYPRGGGPVGAAVAGLGEEIAGLAAHLEDRKRRRETFDAAQREQEFLDELERVEVEAAGRAPPDGEGLHDAVYAAAGGRGSRFDEVFERHAARVPESRRADFEARSG